MEPKVSVSLSIDDEQWSSLSEVNVEEMFNTFVPTCLTQCDIHKNLPRSVEVSVLLTNDAHMQEINNEYRHKNKPTNVLSFPQEDAVLDVKHVSDYILLGDIVLSLHTIQQEAKSQEKPFSSHLAHLIVHGTLHLLGYDHENDEDAHEMETLEVAILAQHGIQNPYESDFEYTV